MSHLVRRSRIKPFEIFFVAYSLFLSILIFAFYSFFFSPLIAIPNSMVLLLFLYGVFSSHKWYKKHIRGYSINNLCLLSLFFGIAMGVFFGIFNWPFFYASNGPLQAAIYTPLFSLGVSLIFAFVSLICLIPLYHWRIKVLKPEDDELLLGMRQSLHLKSNSPLSETFASLYNAYASSKRYKIEYSNQELGLLSIKVKTSLFREGKLLILMSEKNDTTSIVAIKPEVREQEMFDQLSAVEVIHDFKNIAQSAVDLSLPRLERS